MCKEFYYIKKGKVRVIDINGNSHTILEEGKCFNELSFIFESVVLNTVEADDFCLLDVLTRESYNDILAERPDLNKDIKAGLKKTKIAETNYMLNAMTTVPFFSEFTEEELKIIYTEYMDVIYLNPNTLVTAPSHKCNGIYFILQGNVTRFKQSDASYEYVKSRVIGDDLKAQEEYDTYVQQIDFMERKKRLEDTKPYQNLKRGDWLGSRH